MSQNTFSMFPNERFIDLNIYQFGYEQCSRAGSARWAEGRAYLLRPEFS